MARLTYGELNLLKEKLDELIDSANKVLTNLQEKDSEFTTSVNTINAQLTKANETSGEIEALEQTAEETTTTITDLQKTANSDYEKIKQLAEKSAEISKSISAQESKLKALTDKSEQLKITIEDLLPGATSAGLASAFRERKESFKVPKILWGIVFILSMLALFFVAYFDPVSFEKVTLTHEMIFSYFLVRIPFIVPIIWLAIYAGRRHSQALRLEEDYAHKEALSKSFEGYKNQLIEIEKGSEGKDATLSLIERTLVALSLHPGRIYQGKHEDISPLNSLSSLNIFTPKKSADADS